MVIFVSVLVLSDEEILMLRIYRIDSAYYRYSHRQPLLLRDRLEMQMGPGFVT